MERFFSDLAKKSFFLNLIVLGRPWNGIIIGLFSILGFIFLGGNVLLTILVLFFCFFLQYFAGTTFNDLYDFYSDKINMPYRPLESGVITSNEAKILAITLYVISLTFSWLFSFYIFLGVLAFFILSLLYSIIPFRLVSRGFLGNLTLATVTIFIPTITGAIVASQSIFLPFEFVLYVLYFTLFFAFFSILKDFKDVTGDSKSGKKTFVVVHGIDLSGKIMIFGTVLFFLLSLFYLLELVLLDYVVLLVSLFFLVGLLIFELKVFDKRNSADNFYLLFSRTRILIFVYVLLVIILVYSSFSIALTLP